MYGIGRQYAYSQNLIRSPLLVNRLLDKSCISSADIVIEIGAGKGIITSELAKRCKEVLAYEIDPVLYCNLRQILNNTSKVRLINEDFLKAQLPQGPYKVVANIPFNFTSRILNKLLMSSNPPTLAYLILQEEAAYKFIGKPRETQMSLLLKPYFNMKVIERLKRSDFLPKPRVKTVFIEIERLNKSYLTDKEYIEYRDFIVYATTQWKATITDSLKEVLTKEQMKRLSQQIGFDSNSKPLDVCFVQWFELYKYFHTEVDQVKRAKVYGSYKRQLNLQKGLKKVYRTR